MHWCDAQTTVDADTFHPGDDADRAQTAEEAAAAARGAPLGLPEPGAHLWSACALTSHRQLLQAVTHGARPSIAGTGHTVSFLQGPSKIVSPR